MNRLFTVVSMRTDDFFAKRRRASYGDTVGATDFLRARDTNLVQSRRPASPD